MARKRPVREREPNTADAIGRAIQLLALLGGGIAFAMTVYVMPLRDKSTAPSLGLALLCGAIFTLGWLVQRHFGSERNARR